MNDKLASIYPEIAATGSLGAAAQEHLDRAYPGFRAAFDAASVGWTKLEDGDRSSVATVDMVRRLFLVEHWSGGLQFGTTRSSELTTAVGAAVRWIDGKANTADMANEFEDFCATGEGKAFEAGRLNEYKWEKILERTDRDGLRYAPFLRAAFQKPYTRALTPYIGMGVLHFSQKPVYPFSESGPSVFARRNGLFHVDDGRGNDLGLHDAEGAAEALERALSA